MSLFYCITKNPDYSILSHEAEVYLFGKDEIIGMACKALCDSDTYTYAIEHGLYEDFTCSFDEDDEVTYSRALTDEECFDVVLHILDNDDGKTFKAFQMTREGISQFIQAAEYYGIKQKAIELVR